jgi:hypothetical protein
MKDKEMREACDPEGEGRRKDKEKGGGGGSPPKQSSEFAGILLGLGVPTLFGSFRWWSG